ncbi:MAG TPA: hypothetical protein VNJ01_08625 [Bacteriovoracaceae bacterium]|nr:hypothetical protein [Bacteriovoracaceae bacterium]
MEGPSLFVAVENFAPESVGEFINQPRENRIPRMTLKFKEDTIYFYSCAIKEHLHRPWEHHNK